MRNLLYRSLLARTAAPGWSQRTAVHRSIPGRAACQRKRLASSSVSSSNDHDDGDKGNDSDRKDLFRILGLPRRFAVDPKALHGRYKERMVELHPDRHVASDKSPDEKQALQEQASHVTTAYDTLQKPHSRAAHLLELLGHGMEETATGDLVGADFLMQVLELRESIEGTEPLDDEHLKRMLQENHDRMRQAGHELERALEQEDMETAKQLTAQLQYWYRLEETIRAKMDSVD